MACLDFFVLINFLPGLIVTKTTLIFSTTRNSQDFFLAADLITSGWTAVRSALRHQLNSMYRVLSRQNWKTYLFLDFAETGKRSGGYQNLMFAFGVEFLTKRESFPNIFYADRVWLLLHWALCEFSHCVTLKRPYTLSYQLPTVLHVHKERA